MRQTAYPYSSFVLSLITETNEALLFLFVSAVSLNVLWAVSTAPPQNKTSVTISEVFNFTLQKFLTVYELRLRRRPKDMHVGFQ